MGRRSKRYVELKNKVDVVKLYEPTEALELVKGGANAKFDETIEAHFNLGIDPRHADQQLRGTVVLPAGTGKVIKIVAIVNGAKEAEAKEAGADFVGGDDLIEKIQGGWMDFDLVVATPDMMGKVGRLGRVLGAKGLMPNPKSGSVTPNIGQAVKEFKGGRLEYRNDKNGIIHIAIGKASFEISQLKSNFLAIYDLLVKIKPSKSKGIYLRTVSLCSTMGAGVSLEPLKVKWRES